MNPKTIMIALVAAAAAASYANPDPDPDPNAALGPLGRGFFRNKVEVDLLGKWFFDPIESTDIQLKAAPFFTNDFQAGAEFRYQSVSGFHATTFGVFANYHFYTGYRTVPYVGAHLGWTDATGSGTTTSFGFQGGVKYVLNDHVFGLAEFRWTDFDDSLLPEESSLCLGLGILLNRHWFGWNDNVAKSAKNVEASRNK